MPLPIPAMGHQMVLRRGQVFSLGGAFYASWTSVGYPCMSKVFKLKCGVWREVTVTPSTKLADSPGQGRPYGKV